MAQELYQLPEGWEWTNLNTVVKKTSNLNPKLEPEIHWTYIDISSVDKAKFEIAEPKEIKGIDAPSRARKQIEINDVLFATTRPNLKNIAIVQENYSNPIASTGFYRTSTTLAG